MEDAVAGVGKEGALVAVLVDEDAVRKVERGEDITAGAYSEPYAPRRGWNNRSCICAVRLVSVLGIVKAVFHSSHEQAPSR